MWSWPNFSRMHNITTPAPPPPPIHLLLTLLAIARKRRIKRIISTRNIIDTVYIWRLCLCNVVLLSATRFQNYNVRCRPKAPMPTVVPGHRSLNGESPKHSKTTATPPFPPAPPTQTTIGLGIHLFPPRTAIFFPHGAVLTIPRRHQLTGHNYRKVRIGGLAKCSVAARTGKGSRTVTEV